MRDAVERDPHSATMPSSSRMRGIARPASTTCMSALSIHPPANPAMAPHVVPTSTASATAKIEILSEMRAPYSSRESRSRLYWSVPSQWADDGGCAPAAMFSGRVGSYGASTGANTAAPRIKTRVAAATLAAGSPRKRAVNRPGAHGARGAGTASAKATSELGVALGIAKTRVGHGLREVGEDCADHHERTGEEHDRQDELMVPVPDRLHGQRPHAIPGERHLDEYRAT